MSEILQLHHLNLSVPDRFKCILCHLLLKNTKQTICGCRVCGTCIKDYLSTGQQKCPGNEPYCSKMITMDDIYEDNATNREIGNLPVKCPHKSCSFTNVLKNIESHLKNCKFQEMDCENCNERIVSKKKEIHYKKLCRKRIINCKYCKQETSIEDINIDHMNCDRKKLVYYFIYEDLIRLMLQILPIDFKDLHAPLICIICYSILKNSKQTSCGCRVCEECIKDYLSSGPQPCPGKESGCVEQLTINDLDPDYAANREIRHLLVKCPSKSCSFEGSLKDKVKHIYSHKFLIIFCDKCNQKVIICMNECHDNHLYELGMVTCDDCNKEMTICPNNCNIRSVVNLKDHLKKYSNWHYSDTFVESSHVQTCDYPTYKAWQSIFGSSHFGAINNRPNGLH